MKLSEELFSILVGTGGLLTGFLIALFLLLRWYLDARERKLQNRVIAESKLIDRRLDCYPQLMKELRVLSYSDQRLSDAPDPLLSREVRLALVDKFNSYIYSETGLVMNHVTREFFVWLTKALEISDSSEASTEKMRQIAWKLHQLLRSDLGVNQPAMENAIEQLGKSHKHITMDDIENFYGKIKHNDWNERLAKRLEEQTSMKLTDQSRKGRNQ